MCSAYTTRKTNGFWKCDKLNVHMNVDERMPLIHSNRQNTFLSSAIACFFTIQTHVFQMHPAL